jgi:hypothetical protein
MVGVIVCEEHRVNPVDAVRDQLEPQLWRRIEQQPRSSIGLHHGTHTGPSVARVG